MVAVPPYASASLYVGDLAPEVTEAVLFEVFSQVGPVASIRVCRDAITRRSLGYAYVNFHSTQDAERALDTMNYAVVKNRPIRIMWSHRDPSIRKSGEANIFIKSLEKSIDNKHLYDTFSQFGNILSCKVALDEKGQSKGYGFVHFENREAAALAIQKVNGMLLKGKQVYVGLFKKREERYREIGISGERFNNVYVKGLSADATNESVKELFAPAGEIISAAVLRDRQGRPFAFVSFTNYDAAKKAVDDFNGKQINGQTMFVGRAQKKAEREAELKRKWEEQRLEREKKWQGTNLYVKNLDDTVDDEKLRREFEKFGVITSSKVMNDETGRSKGFGFVCFSTPDEANRAMIEVNGRILGTKPLFVALAQKKDQRRAQLEQQYKRLQYPPQPLPNQPAMFPGQPVFYTPPPGVVPQAAQQRIFYPPHPLMRPGFGMQRQPQQPGRPGFQPGVPQQGRPQGRPQGPRQGAEKGKPVNGGAPVQGQAVAGRRGGAQNFNKYPAGARNQAAAPAAAPAPAVAEPLTATVLASMPSEAQKQAIGERLFPLIQNKQPELAGKITGMLLEMDNSELLHLLESSQLLDQKISEAIAVLEAHDKTEDQ